MSIKIKLTPEELKSQSAEMSALNDEMMTLFDGISREMNTVNSNWSANLANNFSGKIRGVNNSFSDLAAMFGFGAEAARTSAESMETVDATLSKMMLGGDGGSFGGGGNMGSRNGGGFREATDIEHVFDDEGEYGVSQTAPKYTSGKERKAIYATVRKYFPDMTNKEIRKYLKAIGKHGCGYAAVVNSIFYQFEGKEELFEKTFGFPMYRNGDFNFSQLLVDYFAASNGSSKQGTTGYQQGQYFEKYLQDRGLTASHDNLGIVPGQTMLGAKGYNFYDETGKKIGRAGSGHAVLITGQTADGMLIVSTWGKKAYVDPSECLTGNALADFLMYTTFTIEFE